MIELILGTYGVLCWLLFKKFKVIPSNAYTILSAILGGIILGGGILMMLAIFHPASKDGRLYAYTTPIVSQVKGRVIETIKEGTKVKKGDVLFKIDPVPYQIDVDRLTASLESAKISANQLTEQLRVAEAATSQARSQLRVAESDFNRQALEDVKGAKAAAESARSRFELTDVELKRETELLKQKVVSQSEYDAVKARFDVASSSLEEAQVALRQANEKVAAGSDRMQSAREQISIAEAQEQTARLAAEAVIDGVNPQVRQIMAELEDKKWDLEQTTTRAPADGYVTQVGLRPGQIASTVPLAPAMVFVHSEKMVLAASFAQNVIRELHPGLEAELAIKSIPGKIFKAKTYKVAPIVPEGQWVGSGNLRSLTDASAKGRVPVIFEYGEDVAKLELTGGSQVTVAVYTEKVHALSIIRKILVRIKSWENFIFLP